MEFTPLDRILDGLYSAVTSGVEREIVLQSIADQIRDIGPYRWVGLYEVDGLGGLVRNLAWSGHGAPEFPTFPIGKGLTSSAVASKQLVNVGDVASDPRYLTAFGSTKSEIIVPILDAAGERVLGTVDVESEKHHAFDRDAEEMLKLCAHFVHPLWMNPTPQT
ncbi:MAG: GAF domain-containing protein [Candidatus Acidiferrales bacterium]